MKEVHFYQRLLLSTDWQKKLQLPFYWLSLAKKPEEYLLLLWILRLSSVTLLFKLANRQHKFINVNSVTASVSLKPNILISPPKALEKALVEHLQQQVGTAAHQRGKESGTFASDDSSQRKLPDHPLQKDSFFGST